MTDTMPPTRTSRGPAAGVPSPDVTQLGDLLDRLRATHRSGRTRPAAWRVGQLRALRRLVENNEHRVATALADDLGRSAADAWLGDIASTTGEIDHALRRVRWWMRRRPRPLPLNQLPAVGWVQYEPLGVVLAIGPWNYPFYLAISPLVAALSAGNCAVVKPSELAPATSALIAELVPRYLDTDAVAVVEGDGATTQTLLSLGFDHALFTGGTEVGRKIMAGAAPTLTPVTLELGGKSPVYVAADADLDVAARRIAWTKLLNSGQTCIAPDYVLVDKQVRDDFLLRLADALRAFRGEDHGRGMPIVNERQHRRLRSYLYETSGVITHGGLADDAERTILPTVVVDPHPDDAVMSEEIFGPILPVLTSDSLDAAIRFVTARPKPLALYAFTHSRETRRRLAQEVSAGGIVFNHVAMHVLVPQLPFGGVGESGMGAYHGEWGFQELSHRKAVLSKTSRPDPRFVYPPYTDKAMRLMRRLF